MAIVGEQHGIFPRLKAFVESGKPVRACVAMSVAALLTYISPFCCSITIHSHSRMLSPNQVWGTCAGMILLSDKAVMQKNGGQALVGGLDVEVCRNYFGSQVWGFVGGWKSGFQIMLVGR